MTEENDNTQAQEQQSDAAEQEPAADAPAEDAAAEEAQAEEAQAEEPAAEEAPAEEAAEAAEAAPTPPSGEDDEGPPSPKQLRKRARSQFTGQPRPQRSAADRAEEREMMRARKTSERSRSRRKRREHDRSAAGAPVAPAAPEPRAKGERKVRRGVVVSSKADKTITVRIDLVRSHRVYGKVVRNSGTLHAHDERNQAGEGDVVRVIECRPLSRTKRWRLLEVVEKAR
jgi:small subunit ribosomal protein S17